MSDEKYKIAYKGKLKELITFFNSTYKAETFDSAFQGLKRLKVKQTQTSVCMIYKLYRSPDGLYVLFESYFED